MANWMHFVGNWALFLAVSACLWYYYTRDQAPRRGPRRPAAPVAENVNRRQEDNKPKKRKERTVVGAEHGSGIKKAPEVKVGLPERSEVNGVQQRKHTQNIKVATGGASSAVDFAAASRSNAAAEPEQKIDDKQFARELTKLKTGSSLQAPEKATKRIKTKTLKAIGRESGENSPASVPGISTPSSSGGMFGDDDFSASVSPEVGAYSPVLDTTGVADMLEARELGPSVLRVTPSVQPQRAQQPKQSKPVQPEETKKQRQNRRKNEARKAELAEQEKARKAGMEQHRRSVRELEGRPAKNGESLRAAVPENNAWTHSMADNKENVKTNDLLDTIEQPAKLVQSQEKPNRLGIATNGVASNTGAAPAAATALGVKSYPANGFSNVSDDHDGDLEEALRQSRADAENSEWTTVPSKATKRRPAKMDDEEKRRQEAEVHAMETRLNGQGYVDNSGTDN